MKTAKEMLGVANKKRKRGKTLFFEMRERQKLFSTLGWAPESCFGLFCVFFPPRAVVLHFSLKTTWEQLTLHFLNSPVQLTAML